MLDLAKEQAATAIKINEEMSVVAKRKATRLKAKLGATTND